MATRRRGGRGTRSHIFRWALAPGQKGARLSKITLISALVCEGKDDAAMLRARASKFCEGMNQM
eukprot:3869484-Pleurochrysis_carterae.AAC.1